MRPQYFALINHCIARKIIDDTSPKVKKHKLGLVLDSDAPPSGKKYGLCCPMQPVKLKKHQALNTSMQVNLFLLFVFVKTRSYFRISIYNVLPCPLRTNSTSPSRVCLPISWLLHPTLYPSTSVCVAPPTSPWKPHPPSVNELLELFAAVLEHVCGVISFFPSQTPLTKCSFIGVTVWL